MDKWLILGMGQKIYKMNPEYFVVPEIKEVLKKKKKNKTKTKPTHWWGFVKEQNSAKRAPDV